MTLLPPLVAELLAADDDRAYFASLGPVTSDSSLSLQFSLSDHTAQAVMNNQPALALALSSALVRLSEITSQDSAAA